MVSNNGDDNVKENASKFPSIQKVYRRTQIKASVIRSTVLSFSLILQYCFLWIPQQCALKLFALYEYHLLGNNSFQFSKDYNGNAIQCNVTLFLLKPKKCVELHCFNCYIHFFSRSTYKCHANHAKVYIQERKRCLICVSKYTFKINHEMYVTFTPFNSNVSIHKKIHTFC